jgi:hypothetical protein
MADTENGSANTELPELSLAKKETTLIDMQNSSQSLNPKETEPVKVNGTKKPSPECSLSSPNHQSPTNTAVNGRLVYVRRKADSELSKSNANTKPNLSHPKKVSEQIEKNLEDPQIKDTRVCDSEAAKPSASNSQLQDNVYNSEAAKTSAPNSQLQNSVSNSESAKPSAPISQLEDRVSQLEDRARNSEAIKPSAPISQVEVRVRNSDAAKPPPPISQLQDSVCNSEAAKPSAPISQLEDRVRNSEAAKPQAPISQLEDRVRNLEAAKPSAPISQLEDRVRNSEAAKSSAPISQVEDRVRNSEAAKPSAPISQLEDRVRNSEAAKPSTPISQLEDSDNHRDITATTPVVLPKKTNELNWEERFCRLQNLLKILDQSVHDGYVKMLQSLNSVELSRLAVELEKRSIHLSVQEVKEMQRIRQLDLLGKYNTNQQQNQKQEEAEQGKPGEEKL